ncbi:Homeobox transcription factor, putative [Penicillium digitatum]|uniref:Homeobox transcription factor, putative n=3 Tax=Penicillium digitatum TaxID=36651 RepID=K9FKH4_PEND2|nr:Homeobox transcription factor, putative [Penicillium digitatum Pd1]EKV06985.1 Homeobox transcription factor, putative [Penicillium digitatum Pd1]EKV08757.1 Homeobox transcription factor, putative [Penicillium digitatum PHI26]QQK41047.1 Homeobox transcription factor, putative [Penicillium digitatum]
MSDPEASVAISSSPSLPATDSNPLNYAFLVHSQKTLTQNLPPRVDNKLLARQKRRRTSPEDHAVLESEYQQNSKPDKAARTSIVNRVSLGEKEVQIWFQNRRQNDRRKSKPLQPHELLAPRSGMVDSSGQPLSDDNASTEPGSSSGAEQFDNDHRAEMVSKPWHGGLLQFSDDSDPVIEDKDELELPQSTQTSIATEAAGETPPTTQEEFSQLVNDPAENSLLQLPKRKRSVSDIQGEGGKEQQAAIIQHIQTTPTKSPPSLRLSMSFDGEALLRNEGELTPSPPKGRNALRIAMSSDGKAVIRGENEPSPSKNRVAMFSVRRTPMSSLRRSSSAVFPVTPRAGVAEKDRAFGRSRDPRNWESFCDTDARSALSTSTSGSNGSPGLFQSRSQRSLPRSASGRFSLAVHGDPNTPISQSMGEKRRKLARTVSSLGRLETGRNKANMIPSHLSKPLFSKSGKSDLEQDLGDSDKENWVPGTRSTIIRRRNTSHLPRPVLRDANRTRGLGISTGKRNRPLQTGSQGKALPELSAEVSAFMASGSGDSQEDDLDCVQGLLSLSQGAWR